MKNTHIIFIALAVIVLGAGVYFYAVKPALDNKTVSVVENALIARPDLSFEFSFPSGEAGYSLIEQAGEVSTSTGESGTSTDSTPPVSILRHLFLMMDTQTYTDYQAGGTAGTAPPAISVIVFDNSGDKTEGDRITKLKNWASRNSVLTSYAELIGEPEMIELDGVNAIRYNVTTGLYPTTFTIASYRGNVYVFAGQYKTESDDIKSTYNALLESVGFY